MQQNINKTKSVISGFLIGVIIFIIMFFTLLSPSLYIFGIIILPIPIATLYVKYSRVAAAGVVVISGILIALMSTIAIASCITFMYAFVGLSIGYCIKNKIKFKYTFIIIITATLLSILFTGMIDSTFIEKKSVYNIANEYLVSYKKELKNPENLYKNTGISESTVKAVYDQLDQIKVSDILTFMPGTLILFSLISAYINLLISEFMFNKNGYEINIRRKFSMLYFPNYLGAALIAGICIGLMLMSKSIILGRYLYITSIIIILFLLIVDAFSFIYYYEITKFKVSRVLAGVIVFILFVLLSKIPILYMVLLVIGMGDFMFNNRRLDPVRNKNKSKWGPPSEK